MRRFPSVLPRLGFLWLVCAFLVLGRNEVGGQGVCLGDLDGDSVVTLYDLELLHQLLFDNELALLLAAVADVNRDGVLTTADVAALAARVGRSCAGATPTPRASYTPTPTPSRAVPTGSPATPTRTATATVTFTPTRTFTFTPTPTPTAVCTVRALTPGAVVDGALSSSDCPRLLAGTQRLVDVYEVTAPAGSALKVELSNLGTGFTAPWVAVIDRNGQFGFGHGRPPLQWAVSGEQPYLVYVTSDPGQPQQFGNYRLTVTTRPCPTPRTINLASGFSLSNLRLSASDCPDPSILGTDGTFEPVHAYSLQVTTVPTQVDIVMRQLIEDDPLDPTFVLLGPDGVEVVPSDQVDDAAGGPLGVDAGARFLAVRPGTYTLLVGGGQGRYSLIVTSPRCPATTLPALPADRPLVCSGQAGPGCQGTLYGSRASGTCGAPLPAFSDEEAPAANAGANLYTLTANPGDFLSVGVEVDGDDAYAMVLGPSTLGNPIVAYDSSILSGFSTTQLGATLVRAGTYTLVLGNTTALSPPDPTVGDPGDVLAYRFYAQKCGVSGVLQPGATQGLQSAFRVTDCLGPGLTPHRNYVVPGQAGQFVMVEMQSDGSFDPALRLWAPDGSVTENDDDPFGNNLTARVARVLPEDANYFVEAYASPQDGEFDPSLSAAFRLQVRSCGTRPISPGILTGVLDAQDCAFSSGQRYEVWTFDGGQTGVASFSASDGVCLQALLPSGQAIPAFGCATGLLEVPVVEAGVYAMIVASVLGEPPGGYAVSYRRCNIAASASYAQRLSGSLTATSCQAGDGVRADWYWLSAGENLLRFNQGIGGAVESGFRVITGVTDLNGTTERDRIFFADPETMLRASGGRRGALLRVRSVGASGGYVVQVDAASRRE